MKFAIFQFLSVIYLAESTVLSGARCVPGDIKVDSCGNLCRCLGDGVQTSCTKIFCPAFDEIPKSSDVNQLWDAIVTISKTSGTLFTSDNAKGKKSRAAILLGY